MTIREVEDQPYIHDSPREALEAAVCFCRIRYRAGEGERLTGAAVYSEIPFVGEGRLRCMVRDRHYRCFYGERRAMFESWQYSPAIVTCRVINTYYDNRRDLAGEVARLVAGS